MQFYFDLVSEQERDVDHEGMDLPSVAAAKTEAEQSAREMVAEIILHEDRVDGMRFEIRNAGGRIVETVRFRDVIRLD
ncbi:hypothetical protein ASE04_19130 [Rhizobium sp. Root708]|uniref:DUF6894 family protein n=1 Tax=Rhizobium sp. Root708 TaxID=1736592 RepID=UPI0006FE05E4|nr:hypothetical protein [Rhizobium sp. Root708]KRB49280.1 hypothetical protein ASE04_19130 [Rhizobium sp. Root708]